MKPRLSFSLLFFIIPFTILGQKLTTIRIDPTLAKGGFTSDLFNKVNFIPLETTSESLFGQITKLETTEKYFIIHDVETNAILFFNRDGKFYKKIKPEKNKYFGDFSVNESDNTISILSSDKLLMYSLDGMKTNEFPKFSRAERFFSFGNDRYAYNIGRSLSFSSSIEEINHDVIITKNEQIKKELFPYHTFLSKYDYNIPTHIFSNQGDGTCWFSFPYKYEVNHLNYDGIIETIKFIFPLEYSLPLNFDADSTFRNKRKAYIFSPQEENTKKFKLVSPFFKFEDKIIFYLENISGHFGAINNNLIYDLKSKDLISLNTIAGDSTSYEIPILNPRFGQRLHSVKNKVLYTSIPSYIFLQLVDKNKEKGMYYSELSEISLKNNSKSNVILIESIVK